MKLTDPHLLSDPYLSKVDLCLCLLSAESSRSVFFKADPVRVHHHFAFIKRGLAQSVFIKCGIKLTFVKIGSHFF
jgi:hypothetical protein